MGMTRVDRKVALLRIGKRHTEIARDCGVDLSVVSHVISGKRWTGPQARKVMQHIANILGMPLDEVFPGWNRRAGKDRRGPFVPSGDEVAA